MAVILSTISGAEILGDAVNICKAVRDALAAAGQLQTYLAGLALTDLEGAPLNMSASDAQAVKSAIADAAGLNAVLTTGTDSRNPGAGYVYLSSMAVLIGPKTT